MDTSVRERIEQHLSVLRSHFEACLNPTVPPETINPRRGLVELDAVVRLLDLDATQERQAVAEVFNTT